ncbi:MAG: EndoU domain-containing protein [Sarcina sp.]
MKIKILLVVLALIVAAFAVKIFLDNSKEPDIRTEKPSSFNKQYTLQDLNNLTNTDNFLHSAIKHIFLGSINSKGEAEGYHYDNIKNINSNIIPGTKKAPNAYGVYEAKAIINGQKKSDNDGYSTFFPNSMSPQAVVNAINTAYNNRHHVNGSTYVGQASNGMQIEMYLTDDNKIISAFPVY